MIRDEHIDLGVAQGIITAEQATRLRALAADAATPPADQSAAIDPDDERFRLIGGFNDIFVAIGILLLVSALFGLSSTLGSGVVFAALGMVAAWALSEVFARRLRLALPAITLSLMFAWAGGIVAYGAAAVAMQATGVLAEPTTSMTWLLCGLGTALSAALHRWRFNVPIDTAIVAGGLACAVVGASGMIDAQWTSDHQPLLLAILGAIIFVAAACVDATDPRRVTRRSDVGFWLHLLAAPLLVQAMTSLVFGPAEELGVAKAIGVLALFAAFGLVALVLDRRALLVSGLTYAGIAIGYLLSESLAKDVSVSLTLLGLAALVLLLSAQWRRLRAAAVNTLPLGSFRQFVPPASV